MKIVEQHHEILSIPENLLQTLERAGRTCYKSEDKITPDSAGKFVQMLIKRGHHAMIEFGTIIIKFVTNRGVTHELVRHRLCSFAQESTRYVNYGGDDVAFIRPVWCCYVDEGVYGSLKHGFHDPTITTADEMWFNSCLEAENNYHQLLEYGWRPEQAREVLPNSLKTEIVVQANIREWRHIFKLRAAPQAHPQMQALIRPLLEEMKTKLPVVFDDLH
jgi:thymidylate synthase (FAD)